MAGEWGYSFTSSLPKSSFPSSMKLMIMTTAEPARPAKNMISSSRIVKRARNIITIVARFRFV